MSKWFTQISWDEAPHLSKHDKDDLYASIPPYQREARSKGIPQLGSGAIYPIAEDQITVADFPIPDHWRRVWGLDTGWNWTAVVWIAVNLEDGTHYVYSCYKRGTEPPSVHADAIKSRGLWIPGVADAADINKIDGRQMVALYRDDFGLDVVLPIKAVEAGLYNAWTLFTQGKLKIFKSLTPWFDEYRFYQRDAQGKVVKGNDHLMDATRYALMSMDRARAVPAPPQPEREVYIDISAVGLGWLNG